MTEAQLIELLLSWLPMIVLIAVWVYFMRRHGGPAGMQQQIVEEYKKNNELLRQIIERKDQRIARLEAGDKKNGAP